MSATGFLAPPPDSPAAEELFDEDVAELGYVMNGSKLWAYHPSLMSGLFDLFGEIVRAYDLSVRLRGILVSACASTLGDSYCSLAWGSRLASTAGDDTAAAVLSGGDEGLDDTERAIVGWVRKITRDPNGTDAGDIALLRDAGLEDRQIFALTTFVALRVAFSTVNDSLGVRPDAQLRDTTPQAVLDAVTYGRPIAADSTA